MSTFETELMRLGLNEKEVAIYLTLLSHGPSSVRKLAGISGINRGTTYDVLRSLKERGLACFYHEDTKQCFVAEDPSRLSELIVTQESELARAKQSVSELIPELRSLHDRGADRPVSRYYEGPQGIRAILLDVLDSMAYSAEATEAREKEPAFAEASSGREEKTYCVYSSSAVRDAGLYASFPDYTAERIARHVRVKTIALGHGGSDAELSEHKWIPATEAAPTYILIYAGKCAFISLNTSHMLVGVVIENAGVYETQKILFEALWKSIT